MTSQKSPRTIRIIRILLLLQGLRYRNKVMTRIQSSGIRCPSPFAAAQNKRALIPKKFEAYFCRYWFPQIELQLRNECEKCVLIWIPKIPVIRKHKDRSSGSYFVCLELFASDWKCSSRAGEERLYRNFFAEVATALGLNSRLSCNRTIFGGWRSEGGDGARKS